MLIAASGGQSHRSIVIDANLAPECENFAGVVTEANRAIFSLIFWTQGYVCMLVVCLIECMPMRVKFQRIKIRI